MCVFGNDDDKLSLIMHDHVLHTRSIRIEAIVHLILGKKILKLIVIEK